MVRYIIRLEGLLFFLVGVYYFQLLSGNWLLFILLFLTPDISIIGYLRNKRLGAMGYNVTHNYVTALLLIGIGFIAVNHWILLYGVILMSHVGMDRFFGFGLKYPSDFKDTHIQKI